MTEHRQPLMVRLFPAGWRDRYADEVAELLRTSPRRWRDRFDLLRALPGEHLSARHPRRESMRNRLVPLAAAALVAAGLVGGVLVSGQLEDGWTEIPMHWWSTLAVLPGLVGLALAAVAAVSRRRAR